MAAERRWEPGSDFELSTDRKVDHLWNIMFIQLDYDVIIKADILQAAVDAPFLKLRDW